MTIIHRGPARAVPKNNPAAFVSSGATPPLERSWYKSRGITKKRINADINFFKYGCPEGGNYHSISIEGCDETLTVTSLNGSVTFKPGASVTVGSHTGGRRKVIMGTPPPGELGKTNFPTLREDTEITSFIITSADPSTVEPGDTGINITIYGLGFTADLSWNVVKYDVVTKAWVDNPYITVNSATYVDSEEVTLNIDVSGSAPEGHYLTFRAYK